MEYVLERLIDGARRLDVSIGLEQLRQFHMYRELLLEWNRRLNLTAITDPQEIEEMHFLDSLTVALALPPGVRSDGWMADVGTGAGFPGVPLKICFPAMRVTLIEATAKKSRFLEHLVSALELEGVEVCTGRAELLGRYHAFRERFDVVVARALAPLRVLAEITLPFCRVGGVAVFPKKGDVQEELAQAGHAFREMGGRLRELRPVPPEVLGGRRVLVVAERVAPCPARYPRRPGIPEKRPL